ncbi:restriction endonuclease subunit S [Ruminococcus flavefaciens]|uniref:restriction endonuclease subunit S n=1 Tax=Ruminococcus flavefaciens TaxID=1265 RepID=UPI000687F130|nr:restriction endonuclease subunit S [Ruminococcus flavefaciens]
MIDTKALRSRILDLAIQGKLTEQLPSDGTAEELYQQIQAEKQALINEGKIKKEKPLPEISADEIPFEIPSNWKLVNFGDIMWNRDSERIPVSVADRKKLKKVYDYYGASGIIDKVEDYLFDKRLLLIGEDGANLLSRSTPIAFMAEGKYWVNNHAHVLDCYIENYLDFVLYYINAISLVPYVTGSAQPKLNQDRMNKIPVPLPPLAEQKRIVERVEEIFRLLDTIDKAQEKYSADSQILKAKLITAGIQGKLTKQLPSDGTAEELYQQIQAEKQKLIKEGKLKKEKPLPPVSPEEVPFEIPENWMWVRWGNLSESIQYGYNAPAKQSGRIKMVRITDIQDNKVQWNSVPYCDIDEESINNYILKNNDILFARTGGTVGKSFIVDNISEEAVYAGYLIRTRYSSNLCGKYLKLFMESDFYWKQLRQGTTATAQPNCNGQTLSKMIIPLPPLAEQKRIADVLERALGALD